MKLSKATIIHLNEGSTAFGNTMTLLAKRDGVVTLECTQHGVFVTHRAQHLKILVPYANIKSINFDYASDIVASDFNDLELPANKPSEPISHPAVITKHKK